MRLISKPTKALMIAGSLVSALAWGGGGTASAAFINEYPLPTTAASPSGIVAGPDGNLWVTETGGNKIAQTTPSGIVTEFSTGITANAGLGGITSGPDGNLWFTESTANQIGRITPAGVVTEYGGLTANAGPTQITPGPDGNLWFTERTANKIGVISTAGTLLHEYTAAGAPVGITSDTTDNLLWFVEKNGSQVASITLTGTVHEYPTTTASSGPHGITMGPSGTVWWTEDATNQIGTMNTNGTGMKEYPTGLTGVNPRGIALGPDGNLWFDAVGQDSVASITPTGVVTPYRIPTAASHPVDLVSGPDAAGNPNPNIWFAEGNGNNVAQILVEGQTNFYFAEGNTLPGFTENLSLFMPNFSGNATIDYYLDDGTHPATITRALTAGQTLTENVNNDVAAGHSGVAVKVSLPHPGVVERTLNFDLGKWHGSTDLVGVAQPHIDRYFAEGSTLPAFKEYLTLVNTAISPVTVDLDYFTDSGQTPVKTLTLAATSRATVQVFNGGLSSGNCTPPACGVGPGIGGVAVKVHSHSLPIIVERPFYVEDFDFGDGMVNGGHDDFGSDVPSTDWHFAEGTTLAGFREYLTVLNPGSTAATVTLTYSLGDGSQPTKTFSLNGLTRSTIEVFTGDTSGTPANPAACTPPACGVGRGFGGVSVDITSTQPVIAERPMYMVHDFGGGRFGGAHIVVGALDRSMFWGFADVTTQANTWDFLTIHNPGAAAATVTVTYYTPAGSVAKTLTVNPHTRATIETFTGNTTSGTCTAPACGVGRGLGPMGVVVSSTQRILVEKPTYSAIESAFGATDTLGYPPVTFS
jgi:virginiamycin B lyase